MQSAMAGIGLRDFVGRWRIERRIDDRLAGATGRFTGAARFTPTADGLSYREEGCLRLGAGPQVLAVREYLWAEDRGLIVVRHGDGRPFHAFDPAAPEARHWCEPDDYRVRYDFSAWPAWRAEWTVRGPRKDYTMESLFTRQA